VSWDFVTAGLVAGRTLWVRGDACCRDDGAAGVVCGVFTAKSALVLGDYAVTTRCNRQAGALFVMQDIGWDHCLKVTGEGMGLVGHAGAVLLRKAADQAGLTGWLSAALQKAGTAPVFDRGQPHRL
jgi:hypothetical protein